MEIKHEYSYNTMTALIQSSDGYQPLNEHLKSIKARYFLFQNAYFQMHMHYCADTHALIPVRDSGDRHHCK